jgi:hypothetical protein
MISLRTRNKSSLYLRSAMVIVTIVFGGIVFCGSNSDCHKSMADNYGGLKAVEFHQALPGRLFFHQLSVLCIPAALKISPVVNLLGPKSSGPKTSYTLVRLSHAFNRTITINAP